MRSLHIIYYNNRRGHPPKDIETMLRMYLVQNWFTLSDEGVKEAIYDSYALRNFLHIDFLSEQVPDAMMLLKSRRILEENRIGEKIFAGVRDRLDIAGLLMHGGTIVDATIISAPSSTKNRDGKRDPEMHQTKKENQWYHGMKVHFGVDAGSGYIHTVTGTPTNAHDIEETPKLLREDDEVVYGDSAYNGAKKRDEIKNDENLKNIEFRTSQKPSRMKCPKDYHRLNWERKIRHMKSSVRCKVEHPFLIIKNFFGYRKVAYRGIAKNMNRFNVLFASANLLICTRAGRAAEFCMA